MEDEKTWIRGSLKGTTSQRILKPNVPFSGHCESLSNLYCDQAASQKRRHFSWTSVERPSVKIPEECLGDGGRTGTEKELSMV